MKIKEFIKSRKEKLNVEHPPADVWQGIQKGWKKEPKYVLWKYAAVFFIGVSLTAIFYSIHLRQQVNHLTRLGDISEEYHSMEQGYISEIRLLEDRIDINTLMATKKFEWLLDELRFLDEMNEVFLKDLSTAAPEEQVVKAIIDYYEKKIRLLNQIEFEQKRSEYETDTNNSPIS